MKNVIKPVFLGYFLIGFTLLSGCSSTSEVPSLGEHMIQQGRSVSKLGQQWQEGKSLIEEGEELIEDGEGMIADGEEQVSNGQKKLLEGRKLVREGSKKMQESESLFYQQGKTAP
ncbi:hypothetical protein [Spartinivicinus poritis]|uniref:Lipoprotein n=1 Tax=Spartinivicinus poritis TaxID=2994640 RepID=A0ABT5UB81_9GAMM|nr:hypothetical protein [Spartinivicinus sp. A2-2]MDE1463627.1 hypothetical protein [Spartinivicinus sp. A2-2]